MTKSVVIFSKLTQEDFRKLAAFELYREGKYTFGECAEALGISQAALLELFKVHQVEMNYSLEDAKADVATIKEIRCHGRE